MDLARLVEALRHAAARANPYIIDLPQDAYIESYVSAAPSPEKIAAGLAASAVLYGLADALEEAIK